MKLKLTCEYIKSCKFITTKQIIYLKHFFENNNETNKREQNKSLNPKKTPPGHSEWKGLQSKTVTKNQIFATEIY